MQTFQLVLIKPSHYDDDGYPIRWLRSAIPSNSLAVLNGIARDCADRRVLGEDVAIVVSVLDETNTRIRPARIARSIRASGGRGLVGMVGVQTNQFPRAVDLAREFLARDVRVCIGGFHVSGCLSMLKDLPPDLQQALDAGITLFAGEAEGRLEALLQDAWSGQLKPYYDFMRDLPSLPGAPVPSLPPAQCRRTAGAVTSFDAGRGCPFQCSFCSIINVQGRKSRRRSVDDIEQIVRDQVAQGHRRIFITDDNFARNADWEPILDRLIELRKEGIRLKLTIQVDALCHRIPRFIEKCGQAGVGRVFIGMESINPEALIKAKKRQNEITEYRKLLQAWQDVGAMTTAGYILGFPTDTPESILRDVAIIKRELPIDLLEFFMLTPGPGSEDHKVLYEKGVWMDPDMNRYDTMHVTTAHPRMSAAEWTGVFHQAWRLYYTPEHMETVMRRSRGRGLSRRRDSLLWFYSCIHFEKVHPLDGGFLRRKGRRDRRPGLPRENPFSYYPRRIWETAFNQLRILALLAEFSAVCRRIRRNPERHAYLDLALAPAAENDLAALEIFTQSAPAQAAAARAR